MNEVTEFLLARITEDEAAAEQLTHIFHGAGTQMYVGEKWIQSPLKKERFLAECAAKRVIIAEHEWRTVSNEAGCGLCNYNRDYGWEEVGPCRTLRTLTAVYKDHPGYRQEWG